MRIRGWSSDVCSSDLQPPPERVDVAVVGSGYTCLSAALELARGGVDVAVLEAQRFGEGASTRSGGMVSGGVNVGKGGDVERLYGADRAQAMIAEAADSYGHFEQLIEREGIDCLYRRSGRFVGRSEENTSELPSLM